MKIGFIGLGNVGAKLSASLLRNGFDLTVLDADPATVEPLQLAGAQAVTEDGTLVHDFLFAESPRSLHVCNAPSPAATSAIPIDKHIYELVTQDERTVTCLK